MTSMMRVLRPTEITDALLVSSTVPDAVPAAWSTATTYPVAARSGVAEGVGTAVYEGVRDGNRLAQSERQDDASWVKGLATVVADAATGPSGAGTADKLVETTGAGRHRCYQAMTTVVGTTYTVAFALKAAERTFACVRFIGDVTGAQAFFDLSAGEVGSLNQIGGAAIRPLGNGWWLCSVTGPADRTSMACDVVVCNSISNTNYTGDGTSGILVGYAQANAGAQAESYVPTTSVAALNLNRPPSSSPDWWRKAAVVYPTYQAGMAYALAAWVTGPDHRVYESVQPNNAGHPLSDVAWWRDVAPAVRWAMFDKAIGTVSTDVGSMQVVLAPGRIDALAVLEVTAQQVTVVGTSGGVEIYRRALSTAAGGRAIDNWYDWFFAPIGTRRRLLFDDLPPARDLVLTVTIEGGSAASAVEVGTLLVGRMFDIGTTGNGVELSFDDYSRRERDQFGVFTFVPRATSDVNGHRVLIRSARTDAIMDTIKSLRTTPTLWVAGEGIDALLTFGISRRFSITLDNLDATSLARLETESL